MTVTEILALAAENYLEDEDVTASFTAFGLNAINDILQLELPWEAIPEAQTDITAVADTWASLPSDFMEIIEIEYDDAFYTGGYDKRNTIVTGAFVQQIKFAEAGVYTVYYKQLPTRIATAGAGASTPAIHPAYHPVLAIGVAYKYYLNEDETDPRIGYYQSMFTEKMHEISLRLHTGRSNYGNEYKPVW